MRLHWRMLTSIVLWIIGTGFLLLLDGQVFRNALVFMACVAVSAVLWLPGMTDNIRRSRTTLVLVIHLFCFSVAAGFLPANFRAQKQFNEAVTRLRQKMQEHAKRESGRNDYRGEKSPK